MFALMLLLLSRLEPEAYKFDLRLMWHNFVLANTDSLSAILKATRPFLQQPLNCSLHELAYLHSVQAFARYAVAPETDCLCQHAVKGGSDMEILTQVVRTSLHEHGAGVP